MNTIDIQTHLKHFNFRQFQDARRNTPLRHILPIAEDQPPPYSERIDSGSCSQLITQRE